MGEEKIKIKRQKILNIRDYSILCLLIKTFKMTKKVKKGKELLLQTENKIILLQIEKYKKLIKKLRANRKVNLNVEEMKTLRKKLMKISFECF